VRWQLISPRSLTDVKPKAVEDGPGSETVGRATHRWVADTAAKSIEQPDECGSATVGAHGAVSAFVCGAVHGLRVCADGAGVAVMECEWPESGEAAPLVHLVAERGADSAFVLVGGEATEARVPGTCRHARARRRRRAPDEARRRLGGHPLAWIL
jgi:hypothetical protein